VLVLLPVPALYRAYYVDWTARQDVRGIYDYGAIAIRDAVLEAAAAQPERPIYLPLSRFNDSTLLFYLGQDFPRQANLTAPPAASALVIAPEKFITDTVWVRLLNHQATVLPPLTPPGQRLIQQALTGAEAIACPFPLATARPLPASPRSPPTRPALCSPLPPRWRPGSARSN
jgi:hypothetical protein